MKTPDKKEPPGAWAALVRRFADDPEVQLPADERGAFGSNGLKVRGRIFAMDRRGDVVVKLPAARIDALVDAGKGVRLEMGAGRIMKEWLVLLPPRRAWANLVDEARAFVAQAPSPAAASNGNSTTKPTGVTRRSRVRPKST